MKEFVKNPYKNLKPGDWVLAVKTTAYITEGKIYQVKINDTSDLMYFLPLMIRSDDQHYHYYPYTCFDNKKVLLGEIL